MRRAPPWPSNATNSVPRGARCKVSTRFPLASNTGRTYSHARLAVTALVWRQTCSETLREKRHAVDYFRSFVGFMDAGLGHVVHDGRLHPHSFDCGSRRSLHPTDFWPPRDL